MKNATLVVTANEAWNLVNFRAGIICALLRDGFRVVAAAPADPVNTARLEEMGCSFEAVPIDPAGLRPWRDLKTYLAYRRMIDRFHPAALIGWTIKPNIYGCFAGRGGGTICFPNVSGLGTAFMKPGVLNWLVRQLYRQSFKCASTVFFQNSEDRTLFLRQGLVRAEQAVVLPGSGVDTEHFRPAVGGRLARGHFLMIARLIADKGVREFVAAAREARSKRPDLTFTIMGQANVSNRSAISSRELQAWIEEGVIKYRPAEVDVRGAMNEADFIVLPSYREGMSRVLLEASAMARPIITCDVPGCRDIVADGVNGLLCAPRDAESLCSAILRAAAIEDGEWTAMGQAGRERVELEFSEETVIAAYRSALRKAGIATASIAEGDRTFAGRADWSNSAR